MKTKPIQDADSSIAITLPSVIHRLDVAALFPALQPLEVELGSGDGSFLIQYAGEHRDRNFIGVERLLGRVRKTDRKANRLGLANIRLARIEASYFLQYLIPANSIEALHLYFPDPWPKRKHRKNRLVSKQFPELLKGSLASGGKIYLRTDDADYFEQMKSVFAAAPFFQEIPTPDDLANVLTDFERRFLKQNIQTHRAAYQLTAL
ncbi:MAG TPA: tRNA (guanosine(46)-N7)-methyltransferase TrmB [Verrucomicrobiae bacterium]